MATTAAQGPGPLAYLTSDGTQIVIQLSALTFTNGMLSIPPALSGIVGLQAWLNYLVQQGALTPGAAPPSVPAMMIQAADPGAAGNNIQITIANVKPTANPPTFDATITETDAYTGLSWDPSSPRYVVSVLGTATKLGSQPGLVHLTDTPPPGAPTSMASTALSGGNTSTLNIPGSSGTAFTLEAKKAGTEGKSISVTIMNVDTTARTFDLTAVWTAAQTGITLSGLPNALQGTSRWEITVTAPPSGFALPSAGTITLGGGINSATAGATALANQQ